MNNKSNPMTSSRSDVSKELKIAKVNDPTYIKTQIRVEELRACMNCKKHEKQKLETGFF